MSSVGDQCAGGGCGCCEGDRGCGAEDVDTGGDQQSDAVAADAQSMSSRRSTVARLSPRSGQESVVDCRRPLRFRRLVCCRRCRYLRREGFVFVSVSLFVSRITEKNHSTDFTKFGGKVVHGLSQQSCFSVSYDFAGNQDHVTIDVPSPVPFCLYTQISEKTTTFISGW